MKITIDIPPLLLRDVYAAAASEGMTLAALVERGLRQVIAEHREGRSSVDRRARKAARSRALASSAGVRPHRSHSAGAREIQVARCVSRWARPPAARCQTSWDDLMALAYRY
jgi:hypothetical protein